MRKHFFCCKLLQFFWVIRTSSQDEAFQRTERDQKFIMNYWVDISAVVVSLSHFRDISFLPFFSFSLECSLTGADTEQRAGFGSYKPSHGWCNLVGSEKGSRGAIKVLGLFDSSIFDLRRSFRGHARIETTLSTHILSLCILRSLPKLKGKVEKHCMKLIIL